MTHPDNLIESLFIFHLSMMWDRLETRTRPEPNAWNLWQVAAQARENREHVSIKTVMCLCNFQ